MNKVLFTNKGNLDMKALTIMGMSVKVNDNPIGLFGTGLKYAIAVCLRHEQEIEIKTNGETYNFATEPTDFRGEVIDQIVMNDSKGEKTILPFTSSYGKTWELWQAFRELYCNAKDENGDVTVNESTIAETIITVTGKAFREVYDNRDKYFIINKTPFESSEILEVFSGSSDKVFYKGIAVHTLEKPALFTYNLRQNLDLTEDRTAKYEFTVKERIEKFIATTDNKRIIQAVLPGDTKETHYEKEFTFNYCSSASEEILAHIKTLASRNLAIPKGLRKLFYETKEGLEFSRPKPVALTTREKLMLNQAKEFLAEDYPVNHPVLKIEPNADDERCGYVSLFEKSIYLFPKAFEHGMSELVQTLMEECFHLDKSLADESRNFQQFLIRQIVKQLEEKKEVIL